MPFAYLLKRLRTERGFSQRRLAQMADIDDGYLAHLENREKCPSEQMVNKLIIGLVLSGRDAWLLAYVATYRHYIDIEMVQYLLDTPDITPEEFSWAVALKFRTPEKLDCPRLFRCARRIAEVVREETGPLAARAR